MSFINKFTFILPNIFRFRHPIKDYLNCYRCHDLSHKVMTVPHKDMYKFKRDVDSMIKFFLSPLHHLCERDARAGPLCAVTLSCLPSTFSSGDGSIERLHHPAHQRQTPLMRLRTADCTLSTEREGP